MIGDSTYRVCTLTDASSDVIARRHNCSATSIRERSKRRAAQYLSEHSSSRITLDTAYTGESNNAAKAFRYVVLYIFVLQIISRRTFSY